MKPNVIVGQSGGPTSVINASLAGVFKTARDRGAGKIYGMRHGIQGFLEDQIIDLSEHIRTDLDIELLKRTPSACLGSCRYKLPTPEENEDIYKSIFQKLNARGIEHFYYIGGNDSMDTIDKLTSYGARTQTPIRFIGVPKTIDNDLTVTDHTPGYGSAAKFIGTVFKEAARDTAVYNKKSILVVEVMGRNAGWLTAASALAKGEDCAGPDLIYLPERVFSVERFLSDVANVQKKQNTVIVAVSEGVKLADGRYVCELTSRQAHFKDSFGHMALGGTARFLADTIAENCGCKTRAIDLNILQRCGAHLISRVDITEAYTAGGHAVEASFRGETGQMIVFNRLSNFPYQCTTAPHDIHDIANLEKKVPDAYITPDGTGVTQDFLDYARPLIQSELSPVMVDGLPRHFLIS